MNEISNRKWNVLLVEDGEGVREQIKEYLEEETFASQKLNIVEIKVLDEALNLIRERKADLVILDIYRGKAQKGGEQTGIKILENIQRSGFVPVVIYTALPEGLDEYRGPFVKLVGKTSVDGMKKLTQAIGEFFKSGIPQINQLITGTIDQAMSEYMWEFVQEHWEEFKPLVRRKPEFLRLLIRRLAMKLARFNDAISSEDKTSVSEGAAHPAEYYVTPPISEDPMLGDVRSRSDAEDAEYLVVLWPSCDMVSTGNRTPKVDSVLCAKAHSALEHEKISSWLNSESESKTKRGNAADVIKNRDEDKLHFLPGAWRIPDLLINFQKLEIVSLSDLREYECLGTLASPFAEAMAARFQKYIGRVGTPDVDIEMILQKMRESKE